LSVPTRVFCMCRAARRPVARPHRRLPRSCSAFSWAHGCRGRGGQGFGPSASYGNVSEMRLLGVALVLAISAIACGGVATGKTEGPGEAGTDANAGDATSTNSASTEVDGASEGGQFDCGAALCEPSQVCVYPPCQPCIVLTEPPSDAGVCPSGTAYSDASGVCVGTPVGCASPYCFSPTPATPLYCQEQGDGSLSGNVSAPVPRGSSHACYTSCA
jgi:hypothetical protein